MTEKMRSFWWQKMPITLSKDLTLNKFVYKTLRMSAVSFTRLMHILSNIQLLIILAFLTLSPTDLLWLLILRPGVHLNSINPYKIGPFGEPIKNGLLGHFPTLRKDNADVESSLPPPLPPPGPVG
jgi:hypothetical protein